MVPPIKKTLRAQPSYCNELQYYIYRVIFFCMNKANLFPKRGDLFLNIKRAIGNVCFPRTGLCYKLFCLFSSFNTRVSSETSFVSYFAKHKTKQASCFAKQTYCFAKFRFEANKQFHVSLFFKRNETARFASFVTNTVYSIFKVCLT
jgi:hypothetical protein